LFPNVGLDPVEHEDAVEVIELVLEDAGQVLVGLDHLLVAVEVDAAQRDVLRADDLEREAWDGEAALLERPLTAAVDDLRVDEDLGALPDVVGEDAALHTDLRRREADTRRVVHGRVHRIDEPHERVVDVVHLTGALLQHRVTKGTNRVADHALRLPAASADPTLASA